MPTDLQQLEQRIAQLEQQLGGGQGAQAQGGGGGGQGGGQGGGDPAVVEAFFKGALMSSALAQSGGQGQAQQGGGQGAQFLSIFSCGGGGGGFTPTQYDSIIWCKSRFFCNPQSLSCLC